MSEREAFEDGTMADFFKRGYISSTVFEQIERCATVDYHITNGKKKTEAVRLTAESLGIAEETVWASLRVRKKREL